MQDSAMPTAWKPPASLTRVSMIIGLVLATLAVLAILGWLPVPVATGAALVFGTIGLDCHQRGER